MYYLVVTEDLVCPKCKSSEVANPNDRVHDWRFNIRAFRVCDDKGKWWSQCLVCKDNGEEGEGWF